MGEAKRRKQRDPNYGVSRDPNYGVSREPKKQTDDEGFVLAESLSNWRFRGAFHLWQVVGGKIKSLTNSWELKQIESLSQFSFLRFVSEMKEQQQGQLLDGFYWADHHTKSGNFVLTDNWNKEVEKELKARGLIFR